MWRQVGKMCGNQNGLGEKALSEGLPGSRNGLESFRASWDGKRFQTNDCDAERARELVNRSRFAGVEDPVEKNRPPRAERQYGDVISPGCSGR